VRVFGGRVWVTPAPTGSTTSVCVGPRGGSWGAEEGHSSAALRRSFCLPVFPRGSAVSLVPLACFTAHLSEVGPAAELELQDERTVGHLVHILALWMGEREAGLQLPRGVRSPRAGLLTSPLQAPFAPRCPAPGGCLPGSSKMQPC